ncbi:unnamed protein product [Owenia fusiformis]|uniref:Uncharacterized protein n=1 Tax=Owenia fusiformis TaxID=6347 RepID=A0A8J1XVP4_OWEFU|nr:unnamed protein product [Owenia fusiformis]
MDRKCTGDVLLVGEGDFSLALSLTQKLNPECLTATSYLSEKEIVLHKQAIHNTQQLRNKGVTVMYNIDATNLSSYPHLQLKNWTRIIFNFPHIGGKSNIKRNRQLLKHFFMSSVKIISPKGQICVTLAQGQGGSPDDQPMREWQNSWQIVAMAACANLILSQTVPFVAADYPLYSCTGFRSQDKHFNTEGAITHIFETADPVELPGCIQPETAYIMVDDKTVNSSRYFATKFSRKLYEIIGHPVCEIQSLILDDLVKRQGIELRIVPSETCPLVSPLSHIWNASSEDSYNIYSDPLSNNLMIGEAHQEADIFGEYQCSLRTSMLDVVGKVMERWLQSDNEITIVSGDVYQKCRLERQMPIRTEMMFIVKTTAGISLKDILNSCITEIFVKFNKTGTVNFSIAESPSNSEMLLEIYDSVQKNITIGKINSFQHDSVDFTCAILDLNTLACLIVDILDHRLIWSNDERTVEALKNVFHYSTVFKSISLYPLESRHDISFWIDDEAAFNENVFSQIVYATSDDCIKHVKLLDSYRDESGRLSKTYSHIYQSPDRPLSYDMSHQLQSSIRLTLAKLMKITLR